MTTGSGLSAGAGLGALLAAIQRSPIVVRFASQLSQVRDQLSQVRDWASWQKVPWANVRRLPDADAGIEMDMSTFPRCDFAICSR